MLASELPLENTDDFVKIIYIRLYGQRKNMKYAITVKEIIKKDGYRFTDFTIHRKGIDRNGHFGRNVTTGKRQFFKNL